MYFSNPFYTSRSQYMSHIGPLQFPCVVKKREKIPMETAECSFNGNKYHLILLYKQAFATKMNLDNSIML